MDFLSPFKVRLAVEPRGYYITAVPVSISVLEVALVFVLPLLSVFCNVVSSSPCAKLNWLRDGIMNDSFLLRCEKLLSFVHEEQNVPVLDNLDLTVKRGESVAIVGASGAGKSIPFIFLARSMSRVRAHYLRWHRLATLDANKARFQRVDWLYVPVSPFTARVYSGRNAA